MAVKLLDSVESTLIHDHPPFPQAETDDVVPQERHGAAAGAQRGYKSKYVFPVVLIGLLGLGLSAALIAKVRHRPALRGDLHEITEDETKKSVESFLGLDQATQSSVAADSVLDDAVQGPQELSAQAVLEDDWGLPSLEQMENGLSPQEINGKQYVAEMANRTIRPSSRKPYEDGEMALEGLAGKLSSYKTSDIVGVTFALKDVQALSVEATQRVSSGRFTVTKFLAQGGSKIALEVMNLETEEIFAMLIPVKTDQSNPYQKVADTVQELLDHEEKVVRKLYESSMNSSDQSALDHGFALPFCSAQITGMPAVLYRGVYIFNKVQLMERFDGNMLPLMFWTSPRPAKEYIAKRTLLLVLHMHKVGICHNDLKWENMFLRSDGTFLTGDFGSSSLHGEESLAPSVTLTPYYADPNTVTEFDLHSDGGPPVRPDPKNDMWSLGVLLYEIFSDLDGPYGLNRQWTDDRKVCGTLKRLMDDDVSPNALDGDMEKMGFPERWRGLIKRLLEPNRDRRISAREVAQQFPDLYGGIVGEVEK